MDNTPEAPTDATQAPASVTPTPTSNEPAQAPQPAIDLGLTAEQAEKFKTFIANSGGFDNAFSKLKTDVSTPKSTQPAPTPETQPSAPTSQPQPQAPAQPQYKAPEGSISPQDFLAQQYFAGLAQDPKYAAIADQIANGSVAKEMAAFNINAMNQDGSLNDKMVRQFLDLKAQTVPAKATSSEPDASAAPTVNYVEVGDQITSLEQAYQVIMQPGHPATQKAEEFIKNSYNKQ
jgi:hypothetical protein